MKKFGLRVLLWLMVLSLVCGYFIMPQPVQAASIQEGVTLHCWNWSFKSIEDNMATIARMGYTAIQTSPIQQAKQNTNGAQTYDWWVFYQPASFSIDNTGRSALGTKAQFKSMCNTAHQYGIKVIVDVVANHMGDNGGNNKSSAIIDDLEKDNSCWHDISKNTYDYSKRYDVTQWCMNGLPDLNTGNSKVQNYVLNFLKECINAGADGFRFDAAKHIETPEDTRDNCASNFWPTVVDGAKSYAKKTRGIDLYCYGEVLDAPGGSLSISSYTKYMSVTENSWSNMVRNDIVGGGNAGWYNPHYHKGTDANKLVLWAESHDNYVDGSSNISTTDINKTWALVAARGDAMSLYLARPSSYTQKLGTASGGTGWANKEVAAVNKFHTAFAGQEEYVASENNIAYVQRGNSGVVLVNCTGTSQSVNVTNHVLKDGTYIDQISGNTFTVSGGRIRGNIGSTGIAVVYNAPKQETQTKTIYFTNSGNWSAVNIYSWYSPTEEITATWPGDAMTKVSGNVYCAALPADAVNVIFNNGSSKTADLVIPSGKNLYNWSTGQWSVYSSNCTHPSHQISGHCTQCGQAVEHHYSNSGSCSCGAVCAHKAHSTAGVCYTCGAGQCHRYVNGSCQCGSKEIVVCPHSSHNTYGVCLNCGAPNIPHHFNGGRCTCGATNNPSTEPLPEVSEPTPPIPEVTEPIPEVTEPIPVVTEPVPEVTEPIPDVTDPVPTEPIPTLPLPTEPIPTEPTPEVTEPLPTEPVPVVTEPLPVVTEPLPEVTEPIIPEPPTEAPTSPDKPNTPSVSSQADATPDDIPADPVAVSKDIHPAVWIIIPGILIAAGIVVFLVVRKKKKA